MPDEIEPPEPTAGETPELSDQEPDGRLRIKADPTKDFFISMLVRDIELIPAIADLMDNSVDGALRLRTDRDYSQLQVTITASGSQFSIADNCGGIEADVARNYAFRFGRPPEAETLEHSIGQFGVGMKRALFKLGTKFRITSVAPRSSFSLEIDVNEWKTRDAWDFEFDSLTELEPEDPDNPSDQLKTEIQVTELHPSVAEDLADPGHLSALSEDIRTSHQISMLRGLEVRINSETPIEPDPVDILAGEDLRPGSRELAPVEGVSVILRCGVAESEPADGGWWVFCNDRLVLRADQTDTTVWGWRVGQDRAPKFHNQYARFRGYAFFDSDDGSKLPWNTTKTGVNGDDTSFRQAKREMLALTLPVVSFLNDLDKERTATREADPGPLERAVRTAELKSLFNGVVYEENFTAPEADTDLTAPPPTSARIQYEKPIEAVNAVKEALGATSNKAVGEGTFDFFYESVIADGPLDG